MSASSVSAQSTSTTGSSNYYRGDSVTPSSSGTAQTMVASGSSATSALVANNNNILPSTSTATATSAAAAEFSQIVASTLKSTHDQMRKCISIDLTACQREVNFLRMIDRKAPLLYEKHIVENAIRRYEMYWLPQQVMLTKF